MRETCELCNGGKGLLIWNLDPKDTWTICTPCLARKRENQRTLPTRTVTALPDLRDVDEDDYFNEGYEKMRTES